MVSILDCLFMGCLIKLSRLYFLVEKLGLLGWMGCCTRVRYCNVVGESLCLELFVNTFTFLLKSKKIPKKRCPMMPIFLF